MAQNLPQVWFDPVHLRQVILNIAKNGIEAMPDGGTLTIASGREAARVFFQISDTGEGIPPEVMEKIFQPFFSTKSKGSGLGLAISQKIMEAHQGEDHHRERTTPGHPGNLLFEYGVMTTLKNGFLREHTDDERKLVGIVIFPEVEVLDFCGPYEVFSVTRLDEARRREEPSPFQVLLVAETLGGGPGRGRDAGAARLHAGRLPAVGYPAGAGRLGDAAANPE